MHIPTANPGTPPEVPENIALLLEETRGLATQAASGCQNADVRAGGLAVVANGLIAASAALGGRLGVADGVIPWLYGASLVFFLLAGGSAAFALRLATAPAFRISTLAGFRGQAWQRSEPLAVQQNLLDGWIEQVFYERKTYDAKTRYLRRGYVLFVLGMLFLISVAVILVVNQ